MFRSRKRKVSLDKKPDKTKKLKVSNKIFRSPSTTKPNGEAKSKLSKILPDGYDSIILTANTKPEESFEENEAVFGCVRLPILTKEDAMVWVKKFERKTFTSYRTQKTWKKDVNTGLFKRKYICNARNTDTAVQSAATTCKGSIIFTIKDQEEIQANPDYYLRDYPSQVIIHFCHNHRVDPDSYMKNLRPSAELRIIFGTYFAKSHSPFSALICHKCDLHSSYGAEFYNVVSNGAICPSYNWCFHEYEKFFMRKFIEPPDDKLFERLNEAVSQYNVKWRSECAVISYSPMIVLSICTPLMKSVFRSGFAEQLITVRCFSTPKTVPKRQKLILFLCHTPIGSLPFGVVVTFAEDTENICEGIRALIKMFGVTTYSPETIIIDENALISKALKKCFPTAQVLFNEFQMLQSIWRIIRVVCSDDDEEFQALYNLFLVTLNSSSAEDFNKNFDSLLVYAEKYPKLTSFLKYFKVRSSSYVLYARPKIEFNTDVLNYTDSGTIILQDVSIKYGNFFNIVQLFDFVSKSYVDHYERKLNKIVKGDLKGFFKTNFYVPLSKIADFTCEKISDTEFLVSLNEMKFFVNAELDTCTCQVGVHGGSCVHQYIVEKNLGLVPECYTPLCDEMLGIFKNILKEKNIKPPLPDSDQFSEIGSTLDSIKSELETAQDTDDFSDIVSSVCCSEISNCSGIPHDMDNLCPMEEIFLAPPDINESFTDMTEEAMSPLVLSEFDDTNEDNEDLLDDSQQYNRESGELEPIESSKNTRGKEQFQNNVLVHEFPSNLEQAIPTTGFFLNEDTPDNVIIYEYREEDIKCNNEVEVVEHAEGVEGNTLAHLPTDGSIIYSYSTEKQDQVAFYENEMNESDRKTAEIAEFLTNLPDTNNSHHNTYNTTPYIIDKEIVTKQEHTVSNGVVVVRNEEYFTDYEVMENNVLSVVTNTTDAFPQNYEEASQHSAQNLITDSYEDNNFVMMSPNDLFDDNQNTEPDKQDIKINVLSSVVIKPSVCSPSKYTPTYTSSFPINLNAIKHKTLRNVKEDSRIRMGEQKITQSSNTIFIHDPSKSEPRKIVLPIVVEKESVLKGIKSNDEKKCNQACEKDVIKLYCNQPSEKSSLKDNQASKTSLQEVLLDKTLSDGPTEEKVVMSQAEEPCQSGGESQELKQYLIDTEVVQACKNEAKDSEEKDSRDDSQKFEQDSESIFETYNKSALYTEDLMLTDCDPEELAKHEFVEIVEIDSDGLEELASQKYDISVITPKLPLRQTVQKSPINVVPLKNLPSEIIPGKLFDKQNAPLSTKCIPLRNFVSKKRPLKVSKKLQKSSSEIGKQKSFTNKTFLKDYSPAYAKNRLLQKRVTTTLPEPQTLLDENKFKESNKSKNVQTSDQNMKKHEKAIERNPNFSKPVENTEKIVSKPNASLNVKQAKTDRDWLPSNKNKSVVSLGKTINTKNQKVTTDKITTDRSDSSESILTDFEDSDSLESFGSGIDDLSEDELYELQYLWDEDSSDDSINDLYNRRVKLSNKLDVKSLKKNLQSDSFSSDDESVDHVGLSFATNKPELTQKVPPGIRIIPIKNKVNTVIKKSSSKKPKKSVMVESNNAVNEKQVEDKLSPNLQPKFKCAETLNSNFQESNKLTTQTAKNQLPPTPKQAIKSLNTNQKGQLPSKSKQEMDLSNKNQMNDKLSVSTSRDSKAVIIGKPNFSEKLSNLSDYLKKKVFLRPKTFSDDVGLDQKVDHITIKKVGKSISETNAKVEENRNSERKFKNDIKLTPNKTKQKINPKILNIKNKKQSNLTVKLDSLPNILLQPHSRRLTRKNQLKFNATNNDISNESDPTSVAEKTETELLTDSFSISNLSKHKDDKFISRQKIKTDGQEDLPHIKSQTVKVNIGNLRKQENQKKAILKSNAPQMAKSKSVSRSVHDIPPTLTVGSTPVYPNPLNQMGTDIKDLEAILTSDKDIDRGLCTNVSNDAKSNIPTTTILKNKDLSFLFDDPRFETVIEDETSSPSMVIPEGTVDVFSVKTTNTNIVPPIKGSDACKENILNMEEKNTFQKNKSFKKTSKRKYSDILNDSLDSAFSIKKETLPEKMVKYSKNNSFSVTGVQTDKAETMNNASQIAPLFQAGKNRVITLLVYTTSLKSSSPNRPVEKKLSGIHRKTANGKSSEDSSKVLSLSNQGRSMTLKEDPSKHCVKKRNSSHNQNQRNDLQETSKLGSMENDSPHKSKYNKLSTNLYKSVDRDTLLKQTKSMSKADNLELTRKREAVQSRKANCNTYHIRRRSKSSSTKGAIIANEKNTLDSIKTKPKIVVDTEASKKKNQDTLKVSNVFDLVHPRRSVRSEMLVSKKAKEKQRQELNMSKRKISNAGKKTGNYSRKRGSRGEDNANSTFVKYLETSSKIDKRRASTKKKKNTSNASLVQRRSMVMAIKDPQKNQQKLDSDLANDSKKKRSLANNTEKTLSGRQEDFTPKKGRSSIIQAKMIRSKQRPEEDLKISRLQADKDNIRLCPVKDSVPVSKLKETSTRESNRHTSSPTWNYESDDFENSIVVSVLEKQRTPRKNFKSIKSKEFLTSSTSRKSIGYEDAFKMFLETSNQRPFTDYVQSDFEKDFAESDREFSGGPRRRTKSVSSPKEQTFDNRKPVSKKMKKSVSWADGLNIIEYIDNNKSDSDDSEILEISKKQKLARKRRKEIIDGKGSSSSFSTNQDQITSNRQDPNETNSRSQTFCARLGTNDSDEERIYRGSWSSTPKRENNNKRSKSWTRSEHVETKLVVLLERNKEIDRMCVTLGKQIPTICVRSRRGDGRIGYKELLHRATLSKKFN